MKYNNESEATTAHINLRARFAKDEIKAATEAANRWLGQRIRHLIWASEMRHPKHDN